MPKEEQYSLPIEVVELVKDFTNGSEAYWKQQMKPTLEEITMRNAEYLADIYFPEGREFPRIKHIECEACGLVGELRYHLISKVIIDELHYILKQRHPIYDNCFSHQLADEEECNTY